MTREEAKELYKRIPFEDDISFIDSIYNDFESRTCKSCVHFKIGRFDKDIPSNRFCNVNRHGSGFEYKGYSCNKWCAKND